MDRGFPFIDHDQHRLQRALINLLSIFECDGDCCSDLVISREVTLPYAKFAVTSRITYIRLTHFRQSFSIELNVKSRDFNQLGY